MNDEEFEDKLRALAGSLHRPDPTAAWKPDILARARSGVAARRPRGLMLGLSMAWVCIAVLRLATPDTEGLLVDSAGKDLRVPASANFRDEPDTPLHALIAIQSKPEYPEVP